MRGNLAIACPAENNHSGSIPVSSWDDIFEFSEDLRSIGVIGGDSLKRSKPGNGNFVWVRGSVRNVGSRGVAW